MNLKRAAPHQDAAAEPLSLRPAGLDRRRVRTLLLVGGIVVAVIVAAYLYLNGGRYESTDNAALRAGMTNITANVTGQVVAIEVHDNQRVNAGDVLFRLDPAPFQTAVDEAEAQLVAARAEVRSLRAGYREKLAELAGAQARFGTARTEAARQAGLVGEGISSRAQAEQAQLTAVTARQAIAVAQQQAEAIRASLPAGPHGGDGLQAGVRRAQAALDRARLNLRYTIVRAPLAGTVTRVDQLQVGNIVTAARPVFILVGHGLWVEANFKEDQLHYMREGQRAVVRLDAFSDRELRARVASFSPGTGNSFALLPAENATGNWVKVVQRLPVRLILDGSVDGLALRAGLSAKVVVDTGHERQLFGGLHLPPGVYGDGQ